MDWCSDGWKSYTDESFRRFLGEAKAKEEGRVMETLRRPTFPHETKTLKPPLRHFPHEMRQSCSSSNFFAFWGAGGAALTSQYWACYEWRKIVLRSELWNRLPKELVDMIARLCVRRVQVKIVEAPLNSHLIWVK